MPARLSGAGNVVLGTSKLPVPSRAPPLRHVPTGLSVCPAHMVSSAPTSRQQSNIDLLQVKLALQTASAQIICQQPPLSTLTPSFLESNLDMLLLLRGADEVWRFINRHPALLAVPLDSWFDFFSAYGMSHQDFWKLLTAAPDLFQHGTLHNVGLSIQLLRSIGVTDRDIITQVAPKSHRLLLASASAVQPVLTYLKQLGLADATVRQMISRAPSFFSSSVEHELQPKVKYLLQLGFAEGELCSFLTQNIGVLIIPLEETKGKVEFLKGIGLQDCQVVDVLRQCPDLLIFSLPNLSRKWRFLTDVIGGNISDVMEYPQYYLHALQTHIGPRFYYVQNHPEMWDKCRSGRDSGKLSLQKLLSGSTEEFLGLVGGSSLEYAGFLSQCNSDMAIHWSSERVVS